MTVYEFAANRGINLATPVLARQTSRGDRPAARSLAETAVGQQAIGVIGGVDGRLRR